MSAGAGTRPWTWSAVGASVRGSAHPDPQPNQDAVRCHRARSASGSALWIAAVSDGHGGGRYVRSDVGARLAVDAAVDHLTQVFLGESGDGQGLLPAQAAPVVDRWQRAVVAHCAAHPFTAPERDRAGVPLDDEPTVAYGATLLVTVVCGSGHVDVAQLGDGDVLVRARGSASRPVPVDERLVAGASTSLCLPTAVEDFRFASVPASSDAELVVLATDGYGNSFADRDWWPPVLADMAGFVERRGFDELAVRLEDWLAESASVGGDDVSVAVVARDGR